MVVRKASFTYERKFNLGDFQSLTLGATVWADVEDDSSDSAAAVAKLAELARGAVRAEFKRFRSARRRRSADDNTE